MILSQTHRVLVVQPSWVGDAVMATPALRALRRHLPSAHISYLLRRYVKPMYTGMPWADRLITYRTGGGRGRAGRGLLDLAMRLRAARFDLAIVLTNSFRSALLCRTAGIERIVGYDREGRGFLLSDRLMPMRDVQGRFIPTPAVKYYMGLAAFLGACGRDLTLELFVTDSERQEAERVLGAAGWDPGQRLVVLNPGAQYGDAKCWQPAKFAAVGDELVRRHGVRLAVSGAPRERRILDQVLGGLRSPAIDLSAAGLSLGGLKEVIRRASLLVTNDTGPRHIAAAFGVPVVTIFGPTHPEWTEIYFPKERKVSIPVFCGPCQKKRCPLDHRCMTGISPERVLADARAAAPDVFV